MEYSNVRCEISELALNLHEHFNNLCRKYNWRYVSDIDCNILSAFINTELEIARSNRYAVFQFLAKFSNRLSELNGVNLKQEDIESDNPVFKTLLYNILAEELPKYVNQYLCSDLPQDPIKPLLQALKLRTDDGNFVFTYNAVSEYDYSEIEEVEVRFTSTKLRELGELLSSIANKPYLLDDYINKKE